MAPALEELFLCSLERQTGHEALSLEAATHCPEHGSSQPSVGRDPHLEAVRVALHESVQHTAETAGSRRLVPRRLGNRERGAAAGATPAGATGGRPDRHIGRAYAVVAEAGAVERPPWVRRGQEGGPSTTRFWR